MPPRVIAIARISNIIICELFCPCILCQLNEKLETKNAIKAEIWPLNWLYKYNLQMGELYIYIV